MDLLKYKLVITKNKRYYMYLLTYIDLNMILIDI